MSRDSKQPAADELKTDRSEAGDTLIEVLLALVILAIAGVALMTGFATSLANSSNQRHLATREVSIRAATAEAIADVQNQQNNLFGCSGTAPTFTLSGSFSVTSSTPSYWNGSSFVSNCIASGPTANAYVQQWTITLSDESTSSTISTIIYDPSPPTVTLSSTTVTQVVFLQPTSSPGGSGTLNALVSPQPLVALENASGQIVYSDPPSTMALSVISGQGTGTGALSSSCSGVENEGIFSFGNCSFSGTGTYEVQATDTRSSGSLTSASYALYTITAAPAASLVFTTSSPAATPANSSATMGKITVQAVDAWGNPVTGAQTVSLTSTSTGGVFSLTSGGAGVTSIQIPSNASSVSFYYGDTVAGSPTITASASGLASATQTESITPNAEKSLAITTQPPSAPTAHQSFTVGVSVEDQYGNVVTTGTGNNDAVKITLSSGTFSAGSATATATASAGVASFPGLTINTPATYTITAADTTHTTVASTQTNQFTVSYGPASKFVFTSSITGNQNVGTTAAVGPFAVQAQDQYGDVISNTSGGPITLTLSSSSRGTYFFTPTSGGTSGVSVTIPNGSSSSSSFYYADTAAGSPTITASGTVNGTLVSGTTSGFTMVPGAEKALAITTQPSSSITAGTAFTVGVSVEDQFGNVITTGTGNNDALSVSLSANSFASGSTTTATASAGVASFSNLKINPVGSYTITASDTTHTSVTGAQTNSFSIAAAAPKTFVFTSSPTGNQTVSSSATVGPFVVQAQDQFGNPATNSGSAVTLTLSSTSSGHPFFTPTSGGTSGVSVTIPNGASSSSSFYYADTAAGSPTITASGTVNGSAISGTTSGFTMVAGPESNLAITTQPSSSVTAGTAFTVGVSVEDQFGNVVTSGTGNNDALSVSLSSGSFASGSTTTATASSGVASFSNLKINSAGSYTITASDTTHTSVTGAQTNSFSIVAAAPNKLVISTQPPTSSITAGNTFGGAVTIEDQFGNVVTSGTGSNDSIKFTLSSGSFASGSTATVTASAGVATFSDLAVDAAGSYTMTASDSTRTITGATTNSFSIVAAAPNQLVFTSSPTGNQTVSSSASVGPFVAQAQDQFGNPTSNSGGPITLTLSSSSRGTYFFTPTSGGTSGVSVTIPNGSSSSSSFYYADTAAGSPTITASGTVNGTLVSGTTSGFTMVPGAEKALAITTQPSSSITAGTAFTVGVSVEDQFGNVITTGTGNNDALSVSLSANSFASGSTTTATASAGVASFSNLKINPVGSYTITASDTTHTSVTGAQTNSFSIAAAAPKTFVFTSSPTGNQTVSSSATVGPFVVQAQDQFGNPATNSGSAVTLTLSSTSSGHPFFTPTSGGTSGVSVTIPNGASSSSSFYYADTAAGSPTITASGTVNGSAISGTTSGFTMVAGPESNLAITTQPSSSVTAGTAFTVGVSVEDQFGNVVTSGTGNNDALSVSLSSGSFASGSTTTATASSGVASFSNLKINSAGSYTITASDTTHTSVTGAQTNSFSIVAAAPNKLVISTQPPTSSITAGNTFGGAVTIEDQFGNVVTSGTGSNDSIKFTLSSGSFASGSTATVTASAGVATFSDLAVDAAGSYTMTASDSTRTITGATTNSFSIVAAAPNQLIASTQPSGATAGTAFGMGVSVEDQFGNVVTSGTGSNDSIAVTLSSGSLASGSTASVTASSGLATFSNLKVTVAGSYTITASDSTTTGVGSVTTNQFSITAGGEKILAVTSQPPANVAQSTTFPMQVSVEDQYGNVVTTGTGNNDNIKVTLSSGSFVTGSTTSVTASAGVANFSNLSVSATGTYTITASDTTHTSVTSAQTTSFSIVRPVSVVGTGTGNSGGTANSESVTVSTTPASNSTVLVFVYAEGKTGVPTQPTVGGAGISGTPSLVSSATPGGNYKEWAFSANASGTSKTVQATFSSSVSDIGVDAVAVTGDNTAVNATGQADTGSGTSPAATLATAPGSGDLELAFLGTAGNSGGSGSTPTGWTNIESTKGSNPPYGTASYYTSTATSTSQTFSITNSVAWATIALDVPLV